MLKRIECDKCHGVGTMSCPKCDGWDDNCSYCAGLGTVLCDKCDGTDGLDVEVDDDWLLME